MSLGSVNLSHRSGLRLETERYISRTTKNIMGKLQSKGRLIPRGKDGKGKAIRRATAAT